MHQAVVALAKDHGHQRAVARDAAQDARALSLSFLPLACQSFHRSAPDAVSRMQLQGSEDTAAAAQHANEAMHASGLRKTLTNIRSLDAKGR